MFYVQMTKLNLCLSLSSYGNEKLSAARSVAAMQAYALCTEDARSLLYKHMPM